uniref:tRNA (guanine(37)-N1)-methyltransferase n=1 Tax=Magallana gigas TaxID=29159 RepID=K1PTG5_MAGGI
MTGNAAFFDPPESVRGMKVLDRNLFRKTVLIPGLAVPEKSIGKLAKSLKKEVLRFRSIKPVVELSAKDSLAKSHKLMLFNPLKIKSAEDFNEDQRTVLEKLNVVLSSFQFYSFDMNYDNWDHAEIIKAVLPEELEAVTGFAIVGHVAHLNLRDGADDYKNLIGQVILDKHRTLKTVVNKLKSIDSEFRNFKMELLAGEPDFTTTVKEHGCTFTFDFSKVYWNTKLGLAVPEKSIGKLAKSLKKEVLRFRSIKPVVELSVKDSLAKSHKLMLFNPLKIKSAEDFNEDQRTVLEKLNVVLSSFQFYSFDMKYDNWDHAEIIKAVLPEELEAVTGFAIVGHVAHLNLRDGADDYKNLIGQVILDKHRTIKTVVNKLKSIDSEFRNFKMELLAGEPDFTTTVKEHGCTFTFDFSKVYWNTKLGTEHNLVASQIKQEDTVFDVFAGVGPFAIPCGKKGITVFANDLNPDSYESLVLNVSKNKANHNSNVHCFNMDGRDFIKQIFSKEMERIWKDPSPKGTVHVLMNLPALAVEFLDSFVGLFNQSSCKPKDPNCLPYVHCYYFSKCENLEQDSREAVERVLGCTLDDSISIREVRNVAPGKEMMCIKFRVPESVLFKGNVETEGYALNCITCDSAADKECGDPFTANQEKYLVKCEPEETYCGKTVSTEDIRSRKYSVHFGY